MMDKNFKIITPAGGAIIKGVGGLLDVLVKKTDKSSKTDKSGNNQISKSMIRISSTILTTVPITKTGNNQSKR